MGKPNLLLACDLDRTVIPDGPDPLSTNALTEFQSFIDKGKIVLAYFSGRALPSIKQIIREYRAPLPDIVVSDVGTSMYFRTQDTFIENLDWRSKFESEWKSCNAIQVQEALSQLSYLKLQEIEKQNNYKVSYYGPEEINPKKTMQDIMGKIKELNIDISIIISINHIDHFSYLDIVPKSATKGHALRYVSNLPKYAGHRCIYAGDSGNDLEPLTIGFESIVVKNASDKFKIEVRREARKNDVLQKIYFAKGGFNNMNGNYVAGILEGLNFFGV